MKLKYTNYKGFMKSLLNNFKFYLLIISISFWFFRTDSLGFDNTNNDSIRWFIRSEAFLQAIKDGNFSETNQKYHPGVTLMLINSFNRQIFYTYQYTFSNSKLDLMSSSNFGYTNLFSKLGIVIVLFVIILVQVSIISELWNKNTALLYFFILSIEPYFIGINRWFHLTSLEVVFSFTSVLLLLLWLKNRNEYAFIFSAILMALGVLTKVTTVVLGVVLFIILLKAYFQEKKFSIFIYYFLIYIGTVFILFPALWVDLQGVSLYIFDSIFNAVSENVRVTELSGLLLYSYYLIILFLKLSPLTIILFLLAVFNYNKWYQSFENKILVLVMFVYLVSLSASEQKIDRYSLVFFQPIFLISAFYLSSLSLNFKRMYIVFALSFIGLIYYLYSPQYSAYYNPIIGGTKTAINMGIYQDVGHYYYPAAEYLNRNYPNSLVYVPENHDSFSFFFKGKTLSVDNKKKEFVVSSLERNRTEFDNHGCLEKIAEFGPFDAKVIAIFKCK